MLKRSILVTILILLGQTLYSQIFKENFTSVTRCLTNDRSCFQSNLVKYNDLILGKFCSNSYLRVDSLISYNEVGNKSKRIYEYNGAGKVKSYIIMFTNSFNILDSAYSVKNTYDSTGNIISTSSESKNGNIWELYMQENIFYNSTGLDTFKISMIYDNEKWNNYKRSFTHRFKDSIIVIQESWSNNIWLKDVKITDVFNEHGSLITDHVEVWNWNRWENYMLTNFEYNSDTNRVSALSSIWQDSDWRPYRRVTYKNDTVENNQQILYEIFQNNMWINNYKISYNFNKYNYVVSGNARLWIHEAWVPTDIAFHISFPDGFEDHILAHEVFIYYATNTFINTEKNTSVDNYRLSQNYPNPFNPITKINYSLPQADFVTLKVYTVLGTEVSVLVNEYKAAGDYSVDLDGKYLASGIYIYELRTDKISLRKKMNLIK